MSTLRMLTLNVCFDCVETFPTRFRYIADMIKRKNYHVVFLQECVHELYSELHTRLATAYDISPVPAGIPYYTVMLCQKRFQTKFVRNPLSSQMGRDLLLADLISPGKPNLPFLTCATVHLESLDDHSVREVQMQEIFRYLQKKENVVLTGDFNFPAHRNYRFVAGEKLHNLSLESCLPGYVDTWAKMYPSSSGYTFDHSRNQWKFPNVLRAKGGYRFDRVMTKLSTSSPERQFTIAKLELVGQEKIADLPAFGERPACPLYMSDHLGIEIVVNDTEPEPPILDGASTSTSSSNTKNYIVYELEDDETDQVNEADHNRDMAKKRQKFSHSSENGSQEISGSVTKVGAIIGEEQEDARKSMLQALLGEEPDESSSTPGALRIGLVLTNGRRVFRRFVPTAPLESLFWWAQVEDSSNLFTSNGQQKTFELRHCQNPSISLGKLTDSGEREDLVISSVPEVENSMLRIIIS